VIFANLFCVDISCEDHAWAVIKFCLEMLSAPDWVELEAFTSFVVFFMFWANFVVSVAFTLLIYYSCSATANFFFEPMFRASVVVVNSLWFTDTVFKSSAVKVAPKWVDVVAGAVFVIFVVFWTYFDILRLCFFLLLFLSFAWFC